MNHYTISDAQRSEYKEIAAVWESAVKATHHFLSEADFNFFKNQIQTFLNYVELKVLKDKNQAILGFMGTNDENLEMLFVEAGHRGKGIGTQLLLYALEKLNITKVDVNQENLQAVEFYHRFGFETKGISKEDGFGKPYPILHLELVR